MTISECVRSSPGRGLVKSLELIGSGPVGLVHTQNFRLPIRKAHLGTTSDTRLFSGEKRTSHFKRVKSVHDPHETFAGSGCPAITGARNFEVSARNLGLFRAFAKIARSGTGPDR